MALLGCFDYLNKVVIREDCSIDETWLNQHASSVVLSEQMTLDNQGGNVNPKNEWDEIIPASEEYITIDTAQDIQTWQQGWRDHFEADEFLSKETRAWDLANLSKRTIFILISSVHSLIHTFFRTLPWIS